MESSDLEPIKVIFREKRIKHGVDYSFAFKYGRLHVLCHRIFRSEVEAELKKAGFVLIDWHIFRDV